MKLLHTSDWHLGRALYGRKREKEFSLFLSWLLETLTCENIDILLIAGDIFDTTTPSNWAQKLYYQFLTRAQSSGCKHIVITAGNHDSAHFLEAPSGILETMNIHVIGAFNGDIDREIISITGSDGTPVCIICAVPYLRERDIRLSSPGETVEEKSIKLICGIEQHYKQVVERAQTLRSETEAEVPIIAMGHLFAAGGHSVTGDGVRELYVGSLAHVPAAIFPKDIDYLALGHLHSGQLVGKQESIRYCGSPLPMSFAEATKNKEVIIVGSDRRQLSIRTRQIPCFQLLSTLSGTMEELLKFIQQLKDENSSVWLEIHYTGKERIPTLQEDLRRAASGSNLEILRIVNTQITQSYLSSQTVQETLEDLTVHDVFKRCLSQHNIEKSQEHELQSRFTKVLELLQQQESE